MFNLCRNEPKAKIWRSDARLIGFDDPIGYRCGAARGCQNYYTVLHDELVVLRVETSYEPFKGSGTSEYWTIVKFWDADYHRGLCDESEYPQFGDDDDFELPTAEDIEDQIIAADARYWRDHGERVESYEPPESDEYDYH